MRPLARTCGPAIAMHSVDSPLSLRGRVTESNRGERNAYDSSPRLDFDCADSRLHFCALASLSEVRPKNPPAATKAPRR